MDEEFYRNVPYEPSNDESLLSSGSLFEIRAIKKSLDRSNDLDQSIKSYQFSKRKDGCKIGRFYSEESIIIYIEDRDENYFLSTNFI